MKPGGSGREYSDMGRWDRRRLRGGQENRGSFRSEIRPLSDSPAKSLWYGIVPQTEAVSPDISNSVFENDICEFDGRRVSCAVSWNAIETRAKRANYVGTCREGVPCRDDPPPHPLDQRALPLSFWSPPIKLLAVCFSSPRHVSNWSTPPHWWPQKLTPPMTPMSPMPAPLC